MERNKEIRVAMDIDDAIMVLDNEKECVRAANYCDRNCRKCELVLPDDVILTALEMAKEALRLMAANEDDRK